MRQQRLSIFCDLLTMIIRKAVNGRGNWERRRIRPLLIMELGLESYYPSVVEFSSFIGFQVWDCTRIRFLADKWLGDRSLLFGRGVHDRKEVT